MPPACAMAIAIRASVTVSMAEAITGMLSGNGPGQETNGHPPRRAGLRTGRASSSTSSNVKRFPENRCVETLPIANSHLAANAPQ